MTITLTKISMTIKVNGVLIYQSSVSSVVTESPAIFLPPRKEEDYDVYAM